MYTDPAFFKVFSFKTLEGNPREALSEPSSIVITKTLADNMFGDKDAMGSSIRLNNRLDFIVTAIIEDPPENSHFKFTYLIPFQVHASQRPEWMERFTMFNYKMALTSYIKTLLLKLNK